MFMFCKNLENRRKIATFCKKKKICKLWIWSGAKVYESCRFRKMLKNAYLAAKIGFDTADNEPSKVGGS